MENTNAQSKTLTVCAIEKFGHTVGVHFCAQPMQELLQNEDKQNPPTPKKITWKLLGSEINGA